MRVSNLMGKPIQNQKKTIKTYKKIIKVQSLVEILRFLIKGRGVYRHHLSGLVFLELSV